MNLGTKFKMASILVLANSVKNKMFGAFDISAAILFGIICYINWTALNASNEKHKVLYTWEINNNVLKFPSV